MAFGPMSLGVAHELASDRLTVVMREPGHLTLEFHIDELSLLRRLLAPDTTVDEFMISMAAMSDTTFDKVVDRGRLQFESQVVILDQNDSKLALLNWRWTPKEKLREKSRERAMAAVVGGELHSHDPANEIIADAISMSPVSRITLRLPKQASKILVVAYRPRQTYLDPADGISLPIEF
jgi:hypothetical protein